MRVRSEHTLRATRATSSSHISSIINRTSLAYMAPATYMVQKMVQVAMMNVRKIQRLYSDKAGENEHVPLAPFYHQRLSRKCERGWPRTCQAYVTTEGGHPEVITTTEGVTVDDGDLPVSLGALDFNTSTGGNLAADGTTGGSRAAGAGGVADPGAAAGGASNTVKPSNKDGHNGAGRCGIGEQPPSGQKYAPLSRTPLLAHDAAAVARVRTGLSPGESVRLVNKARVRLTVADMPLLHEKSRLNDELMNSFVSLVNHRDRAARAVRLAATKLDGVGEGALRAITLPRAFMFGTFFFSRLSERAGSYDYDGVRQWGVKGNLQLDDVHLILVSVNIDNSHWVLVAINERDR